MPLFRCLSALLPLVLAGAALPVSAQEYTADGTLTDIEEAVRWHLNRARFEPDAENTLRGTAYTVPAGPLQPVAPHALLTTASRKHNEDLAHTNTFQHETPAGALHYAEGSRPWDRGAAEGYNWSSYSENIAAGYTSALAAHVGWWNSAGHRNNMLGDSRREIGVGYHYQSGTTYYRYYAQNFGNRSGSSEHFFTGTLFADADGDGLYDPGEGAGEVRVEMVVGASVQAAYDVSGSSGSFAVPIRTIADASTVTVRLTSAASGPLVLHVPQGYDFAYEVGLRPGESVDYGTFTQPSTTYNRGLRDTAASPAGFFARGGIALGNGWVWQDGLGAFHLGNYPWIYHGKFGWAFVSEPGASGVWLYHTSEGWLWTSAATYPYFHRHHDGATLFLDPSSTPADLWLYNFSAQQWENVTP